MSNTTDNYVKKLSNSAEDFSNQLDAIGSQPYCFGFEAILQSCSGHIYWKDKEGKYSWCNTSYLESCGFKDLSSIVGKKDSEIFLSPEAQIIRGNDHEVMATGKTMVFSESFTIDKKKYFVKSIKSPLLNYQKDIVGVICRSVDIVTEKLEIKSYK